MRLRNQRRSRNQTLSSRRRNEIGEREWDRSIERRISSSSNGRNNISTCFSLLHYFDFVFVSYLKNDATFGIHRVSHLPTNKPHRPDLSGLQRYDTCGPGSRESHVALHDAVLRESFVEPCLWKMCFCFHSVISSGEGGSGEGEGKHWTND